MNLKDAANWAKGADGERRTAATLADLPPPFVVLHDLHVPGSKANIDHLVIGPTGVFVIDSKAYSGGYTDGSGTLWQGKWHIRREVDTVEFIATRLTEHLDTPVHTILCFTEATLPRPVTELGATKAVTLGALCGVILSEPVVHSDAMVGWLARLAGELVVPIQRSQRLTTERPRTSRPPSKGRIERRAPPRPTAARAAPSFDSSPPRTSARKKKSSIWRPLLALGALLLLLRYLPQMASGAGSVAADSLASSTTTTLPVTVGMKFSCPAPGAGYTAEFTYPAGGSIFRRYEVSVAFVGNEIYRERYRMESMPPPPLTGLWPGAELLVTTTTLDAEPKVREQKIIVPAEPC